MCCFHLLSIVLECQWLQLPWNLVVKSNLERLSERALSILLLNLRFCNLFRYLTQIFQSFKTLTIGLPFSHLKERRTCKNSAFSQTGVAPLLPLMLTPSTAPSSSGSLISLKRGAIWNLERGMLSFQKETVSLAQIMIELEVKVSTLRSIPLSKSSVWSFPQAWLVNSMGKMFFSLRLLLDLKQWPDKLMFLSSQRVNTVFMKWKMTSILSAQTDQQETWHSRAKLKRTDVMNVFTNFLAKSL